MFGFIIRQLRHRPGRGAGLGAGILVASAGFCLLTSAVDTQQARVHATVDVGWLPAWRAARGRPTDVISGSAARARRAPGVHGPAGLVVASLLRAPWRAATGAAALGISVVTLSILLSLNARFGGQIGNSALSDIVDLQARSIDYLSAAFAVVIGAASVADTVYLGMRERAAEFAVLTAQGWRRRHVARVALGEALAIGVVGRSRVLWQPSPSAAKRRRRSPPPRPACWSSCSPRPRCSPYRASDRPR
jgi:predicted lysophospholipase L1 biosynthesis ABC-type transport system permease subunit